MDILWAWWSWIASTALEFNAYLGRHPEFRLELAFVVAVVAVICIYSYYTYSMPVHKREKRAMSSAERDARMKITLSDCITDAVEDAHYKGLLTREETLAIYSKIGRIMDLRDLLPRGQQTLKEEIKGRLAKGENKPVPLPDSKTKPPKLRKPNNPFEAFVFRHPGHA